MDMGRERLTLGLLLRVSILLTAVCLCIHVYLETGWKGRPAPLALGRPTQSSQIRGQQSRMKQLSAEAEVTDKGIKRRISYVRTLKKDNLGKKDKDPSPLCCPPLHLHKKVRLVYHQLLSS